MTTAIIIIAVAFVLTIGAVLLVRRRKAHG